MRIKFLFITLFVCTIALAQSKGSITGVLTDKEANNATLPFANAAIKGTTIGTTTDEKGKYTLTVAAGNHTIVFSFLGYENIEVPVTVKAGETITINSALGSGSFKLEDVVVKASAGGREKESALLLDQKKAVEIKQSIGAQEMARKGVSDVATAVTKTTGITKQEGSGNIFVRGLGDRYNSTTMNGLPIPSNDPEKKNINLEIFSTDIVEYVGIDKVYSSKLFGDFAGGNVDIVSKDHKGKGFLKIDIGSKGNTNALNEESFNLQKGYNSFGFDSQSIPSNSLSNYNYSSLELEGNNPVASSFGLSTGKSFNVGSGKLSVFFTSNWGSDYNSIKNGSVKSVNGTGVINKDFQSYTKLTYNTSFNGMLNVGYKWNNNKIYFNSLYINTSTLSKREYTGYFVDGAEDNNGFIRRNYYEKNSLFINQLLGDHKISERSKLNWGVSFNNITGDQPDRNQNTLNTNPSGQYFINSISFANNHRYFQFLTENEVAMNLSIDYKFSKDSEGDFKGKLTAGYSGRSKKRELEATQFNFKTNNDFITTIVDINQLDSFYNQENYSNGFFEIATFRGGSQTPNATKPQTYSGNLLVNGGYINTEYKLNKLTAVLGLRAEQLMQKVEWNTSLDPVGGKDDLEKLAFLPSLTMRYELNEKQNMRFGFSKTYTLPQFKERALFIYEDVEEAKIGNPNLYESDDYNVDLKWEFFPKNEELISLTAFGKYIQNPINEVTIVSSTNDISFINTGDSGIVAGAELEYRKLIFNSDEDNTKKLTAGFNVSYLHTEQKLSSEKVQNETDYNVDFTEDSSKLTGASDLLLNADLSFFKEWNKKQNNLMATLAYTYFSDRVYSIGTNGRGNQVDKAFGALDLIIKSKIYKNIGIGFVFRNLLDPTIDRVQENSMGGDVIVLTYKKGLNLGLNLNYQF